MPFFSCCKPVFAPANRGQTSDSGTSGGHSSIKLDAELSRSANEGRILQRAPLQITADGKSGGAQSSRSLFEASAVRVATHEEKARLESKKPEKDHHGIPQKFLEAYLAALQEGNIQYVEVTVVVVKEFAFVC